MNQEIDILTLNLQEAWEMFLMLAENNTTEYEKARWGIKIPFDIYDHFSGATTQKIKVGKINIKGKAYDSSDFYSELELRKKIIKEWLLENFTEEKLYTARGG